MITEVEIITALRYCEENKQFKILVAYINSDTINILQEDFVAASHKLIPDVEVYIFSSNTIQHLKYVRDDCYRNNNLLFDNL